MSGAATTPASPACPFHAAAAATAPTVATDPRGCPVSAAAAAFDPFEDGYQQSPPNELRWARAQEPIFYAPKLGYWVVARYADVQAIFRDHHTFSPSIALEKITPTGEAANAVLASYGFALNRTLVNEDEPAHMARRRLLMEPFTPAALAEHEPMVRELARAYIDRFIDDGRADLVEQMLWELPLTVALHFLGVPEEDMPKLRQYSIAHTVNTWGRPSAEQQVAVAHAVGNFWQLAGEILAKMRQNPDAPGWMPFGIRMQREHPEVVTDSYLHSMMMAGIVAAHETTANATANALKLLLSHPAAWQELCNDPSLIPNAVEECLRHNGSVAAWRRLVTRDTEVGGVKLAAGCKLLIVMASANHDEAQFPDADAVDLRRDNAVQHLTFGYGAHQCMGKNLARMELRIFLDEFTRRLPHMRLAEQRFSYLPNTSFRGPEHLWVEWDPARNPERTNPGLRETPRHAVRLDEPPNKGLARPLLVQAAEAVADGVLRLTLAAPDGRPLPRWTPGAHLDIECGDTGLTRSYSLCSDPDDARSYQVAVLRDPQSRGGSTWMHQHAQPGTLLRIRGPRNHFAFQPTAQQVILIAGGIGITPIAAMAREAHRRGLDYRLHYCGRSRRAMAMLDELQTLHGKRLSLHVGDEADGVGEGREGGRADLGAITAAARSGQAQVWACGPERLLNALQALADDAAAPWPDDTLHIEHFTAHAATLDASKEQAFEVELKVSGLNLSVPADRTLLSVLRATNLDIPSDCEEGLCGSCELRVLNGSTAGLLDHRDRVLTRAERAAGDRVISCCSRACGGQRLVLDL